MDDNWTANDLLGLASAYQGSCLLFCAVQLDLFTALDRGPRDEAALAEELGCVPRAFDMLLTALEALGFIDRRDGTVTAAPSLLSLLSRNSRHYLGYIIQHHGHIMPGWHKLTRAVHTGSRTAEEPTLHTHNPEEREAFLMGMFNVAELQAGRIAEALDLTGRQRLIDVGGGPGTYAVYFCRRNPELEAVILDLPGSEPFATRVVEQFGLADRIRFQAGDYLVGPYPGGQDVAWLSQVLHGESPANARAMLGNAAACLNPGGLLCVQEFMLDQDRKGPVRAALFGLNMLVETDGGQAYTDEEIKGMLQEAGAIRVREVMADLPESCRILVGEMP